MTQQIEKTITIHAPPSTVWNILTKPDLMKQWMGEPEMEIEVITDWHVGTPIVIKGFHHIKFENKGTILRFDPPLALSYNYLSSLSRLPYKPENHTTLAFTLTPVKNHTSLTLTLSNFPTESIFKHVDFYWNATLEIMKKLTEA